MTAAASIGGDLADEVAVARSASGERYEITVNGVVAGFAAILESDTHVAFTHTEVDDAYQGRGLAQRLAAESLADVAASGRTIIPLCPYIARYLRRNEVAGATVEWPNTTDAS